MKQLVKYFPELTALQIERFEQLQELYCYWNEKINVISRKDIQHLYLRHVLHSLAIAKVIQFKPSSRVLDVGTGGGFPGIPLAILFDQVDFHLVDVIGKKIRVVNQIKESLSLSNVKAEQCNVKKLTQSYDFIVSRAVTNMSDFVLWCENLILRRKKNKLSNGILYLKGGDLKQELSPFKKCQTFDINMFFNDAFFDTKKVVYLPMN